MRPYTQMSFFAVVVWSMGMLLGCNHRQVEVEEGETITFESGVASKGVEKNQFAKWDALELFALEGGAWDANQNKWFFAKQELLKGSNAPTGNWSYAPLKRWPKSKLSFFAFYPSTALASGLITNVKNEKGTPVLDYTVPTDVMKQLDLLTAVQLDVLPSKSPVALEFRHATARITFSARLVSEIIDKAYVRLNKLTLAGVHSSATLTLYDPAPVVPEVGGWSDHKIKLDYGVVLDTEASSANIAVTPHRVVRDEHTLFMIPQVLSNKKDGTDQRILVNYSYSIDQGKTWTNSADEIVLAEVTPFWEPGKNYNYVLAIKPGGKLELNCTILPWGEWFAMGSIGGLKVDNSFTVKVLQPDPSVDFTLFKFVAMEVNQKSHYWDASFANFTSLKAVVTPYAFGNERTKQRPSIYPYTINSVTLWGRLPDTDSVILTHGKCNLSIGQPGNVTIVVAKTGITSIMASVNAWGRATQAGLVEYVGPFKSNPISLIYCDNLLGLSDKVTSVWITTSAGTAKVNGFEMKLLGDENKFIASSVDPIDMSTAIGDLPKNYPFTITGITLCDKSAAPLASVLTDIKITQSGSFTVRIIE